MKKASTSRNAPARRGGTQSHFKRAGAWAAIFVVALLLRIGYLYEVRSIPFFQTTVGDAASYDRWARQIAAGDWLGDEVFYQAPAYPYFVATVYAVFGHDTFALRIVQAGLGALSCVLLGLAGSRFLSRRAGLLAAAILAIYPPAIFFDGLIQKTSLGLFLMTAVLWRAGALVPEDGSADKATWRRLGNWFVLGLLLGAFGLTRENALVLILVMAGWLWLGFRDTPVTRRLAGTAALGLGLLLTLGVVAWRNYHVGGEWAITTVQAGPNFYIGNHAGATGRYTPLVRGHESPPFERADARMLAEQAVGRPLTDKQVSQFWLDRAWEFIRNEPLEWLKLLGTKLLLTFNRYEITDTEGYSVYRAYSALLGVLGALLHFGLLCPLAAAGVVLTWPSRRRHGALYVMGLALTAGIVAFYVFARYRFPLVPILILFAAAGILELVAAYRSREVRPLAIGVAALVGAAVLANLRVSPERQLDAMAFANLGTVMARNGDLAGAANVFEIAVEENPAAPELHYNLGLTLRLSGDARGAIEHLHEAKQLDPNLIEVDYQLGLAYETLGDAQQALAHYRAALAADPADSEALAGIRRITGRSD